MQTSAQVNDLSENSVEVTDTRSPNAAASIFRGFRDRVARFILKPAQLDWDETPSERRNAFIKILNRARVGGSMNMVCGELLPPVFDDDDIIRAFQDAFDRGVTVRMVRGVHRMEEQVKLEEHPFVLSNSESQFSVRDCPLSISEGRPRRHFAVVDGTDVRIEDSHEFGQPNILAFTKLNAGRLAGHLLKDFEALYRMSRESDSSGSNKMMHWKLRND